MWRTAPWNRNSSSVVRCDKADGSESLPFLLSPVEQSRCYLALAIKWVQKGRFQVLNIAWSMIGGS